MGVTRYQEIEPTDKMREAVARTPRRFPQSGETTRCTPTRPIQSVTWAAVAAPAEMQCLDVYVVWHRPVEVVFRGYFMDAVRYQAGGRTFLKLCGQDIYLEELKTGA